MRAEERCGTHRSANYLEELAKIQKGLGDEAAGVQ
jgi:hypothetical protein